MVTKRQTIPGRDGQSNQKEKKQKNLAKSLNRIKISTVKESKPADAKNAAIVATKTKKEKGDSSEKNVASEDEQTSDDNSIVKNLPSKQAAVIESIKQTSSQLNHSSSDDSSDKSDTVACYFDTSGKCILS